MRDYSRLDAFLDARLKEIYPEPDSDIQIQIMQRMLPALIEHYEISKGACVLDVGSGNGIALTEFQKHGMVPTAVCFGEEAETARAAGFEVLEEDMSFLSCADESFDVIWARHVMEHSVFPFFTLSEMYRILKPGGVIYVEVPAPDTSSVHENNKNHYSVMNSHMWGSLMLRVGFPNIRTYNISFNTYVGKDTYLMFDGRK